MEEFVPLLRGVDLTLSSSLSECGLGLLVGPLLTEDHVVVLYGTPRVMVTSNDPEPPHTVLGTIFTSMLMPYTVSTQRKTPLWSAQNMEYRMTRCTSLRGSSVREVVQLIDAVGATRFVYKLCIIHTTFRRCTKRLNQVTQLLANLLPNASAVRREVRQLQWS